MELRGDGTFVAINAGAVGGVDQWKLDDGTYCTSTTDWSGTYTWDGKVFAGTAKGAKQEAFSGPFEKGQCADGACSAQAKFANDANIDFDDFMNNQGGLWCQRPKRKATGNCP